MHTQPQNRLVLPDSQARRIAVVRHIIEVCLQNQGD